MASYKQRLAAARKALQRTAKADKTPGETPATLAAASFARELERAERARKRYHNSIDPGGRR